MEFLGRYEHAAKLGRHVEVLRCWRNHLIQNDPMNQKFHVVAAAYDRADVRYAESLANLAPDVSVS